jgi:hypothetical protein
MTTQIDGEDLVICSAAEICPLPKCRHGYPHQKDDTCLHLGCIDNCKHVTCIKLEKQ